MILNLPFAYQAEILPTRRHTKPRSRSLRGYTPVKIAELASHEVDEAIAIKVAAPTDGDSAANWTTILAYGNRLFRPAAVDGHLLAGSDIENAVSAGNKFEVWTTDVPAAVCLLPSPGVRLNRAISPAMYCNTPERQAAIDRFGNPQIVCSDETSCRAEAQSYYSHAIVSIDGVLHVETSEPVWGVKTRGDSAIVEIDFQPTMMGAANLFRLDQRDRAVGFARSLGNIEDDPTRDAVVAFSDFIELARIDLHELAKVALAHQHALYILFCRLAGEPRYDWRNGADNRRFLSAHADPREGAAVDILEGMERAWRRIETEFPDASTATSNGGFIAEIVQRWAFDKEQGLSGSLDDLTEDDLAALADLKNSSLV